MSYLLLYSPYRLKCQCVEFQGFLSNLFPSSCTFNKNVPLFEIPLSHLLGLVCASFHFVSQSSVGLHSLFFVYILSLPSLIHFIGHFLCNPWLFLFPLYFSNPITHSIWYTFVYIILLHFHVPTFTLCCTKFFV